MKPDRVGFTGTQEGMTGVQKIYLAALLGLHFTGFFHHGGCIGADSQAHLIAMKQGFRVVVHPGVDRNGRIVKRGQYDGALEVKEAKFFLDRNKDIVDATDTLVAIPKGFEEELRSGTWATVRYARSKNVKVIIVWPDGKVQYE